MKKCLISTKTGEFMLNGLYFKLITPSGTAYEGECVSVNLTAADDNKGNGGGSLGILRGHLPMIAALKNPSEIIIKNEKGEQKIIVYGGFAKVKDNTVTVISENV